MSSQKRVLGSIRRGSRNSIVASVSKRRGQKHLLDVRLHKPDGLQIPQPTKLAISDIDAETARGLISLLLLFLALNDEAQT